MSRTTITVTGDITVDWNIACTGHSRGMRIARGVRDSAQVHPHAGGPLLIARLIESALSGSRPPNTTCKVRAVKLPVDKASIGDDRWHNFYAMWTLFDQTTDSPVKVWRVEEFMGLGEARGEDREEDAWRLVPGDAADSDLVIIDDSGRGFRNKPAHWPLSIREPNANPWVILKHSQPLCEGDLWDELYAAHVERLCVVVAVEDLRLSDVQISRELSWEQTATDIARELLINPRINALSRCRFVVVSLGPAGAVLFERGADGPLSWLFYDPQVVEGMWEQERPGQMIGYNSCITASIALRLIAEPDAATLADGISAGLSALRRLHLDGYGTQASSARKEATFSFPFEAVVGELSKPSFTFFRCRIPPPLSADAAARAEPWMILAGSDLGNGPVSLGELARNLEVRAKQILVDGPIDALVGVPIGRFGDLLTVDRREIESYRSIRRLMEEYCGEAKRSRPLSIAAFGPPGSGKSFGIIQIAKSLSSGSVQKVEFNLSQFGGPADLMDAFHLVRDVGLSGKIPLVFWDEFDSKLGEVSYGWLRHFLAPMQDGLFRHGQLSHPIGRAIFVFAGGISESMDAFGAGVTDGEKKNVKLPDFVSRLRGHINILGANPLDETKEELPYYLIRRALLLRTFLERDHAELFDRATHRLNIDDGVLRALLFARRYKHGARSIEAVIGMSVVRGRTRFERSSLPAVEQLNLHVDADDFRTLVGRIDLTPGVVEATARAIFEEYRDLFSEKYPGHSGSPSLPRSFDESSEQEKEQNRDFVWDIPRKLLALGYALVPARDSTPNQPFSAEELEILARLEHERWLRMKLRRKWRHGESTSSQRLTHKDMCLWDGIPDGHAAHFTPNERTMLGDKPLREASKELNRRLVRAIPSIVAHSRLRVERVVDRKNR